MKRLKEVKDLTITHGNGDVDEVKDGSLALSSFENKKPMNVSETKVVTFHAVDHIEVVKRFDTEVIPDESCEKGCESMTDPSITGLTTLNVMTNEEFDPTENVKAYDDNGNEIPVEVKEN